MKRTVEVEVRPTAYPSAFLVAARIAQRRNPGWQAGTPIVETERPGPEGGRIYEVELVPLWQDRDAGLIAGEADYVHVERPYTLMAELQAAEPADEELYPRCVYCGDPIDYCQGHGLSADGVGYQVIQDHWENDIHTHCHPDACDRAAQLEEVQP